VFAIRLDRQRKRPCLSALVDTATGAVLPWPATTVNTRGAGGGSPGGRSCLSAGAIFRGRAQLAGVPRRGNPSAAGGLLWMLGSEPTL